MALMDDLLLRAVNVNHQLLALGNETFEAAGAVFVRNTALPRVWDANHIARVTACTPDEIDALLARADQDFAFASHREYDIDPFTPPEFVARLAQDGYRADDALVMLLEGDLRGGRPKPFDIRPVETNADWEAYGTLLRIDWQEDQRDRREPEDASVADDMLAARRAKSPAARYWLAWLDGIAVSYLLSWEGTEGVGQVEDLMTHPDYRHRGLATALIHHCVADARAHGAGPVVIVADPTDTPKQMYEALGFGPLCVKRNYLMRLDQPPAEPVSANPAI
jgi:ribosomal protein S18 acetylase RimI-like enzyme